MKLRIMMVLLCLGMGTGTSQATTTTYSGFVNVPGNLALVYSDLRPALFGNDNDIANNVALYPLSVPVAGNVTFTSLGYTAGGVEPYFSLFQGNGTSATYLDSNYFIPAIDFSLTKNLAAGNYMMSLGVWMNMSFAENYGTGTLNDGFTSVGDPSKLGNYYYELAVTTPGQAVPEPTTLLLVGAGLASLIAMRKKLTPPKYR
jgi:hypothetical protein